MTNYFKVKKLINILKDSKDLVFFSGAGMSTESGIPDYISSKDMSYRSILTLKNFEENPKSFYDYFIKNRLIYNGDVKPNIGHLKLTKLEYMGFLKAIITQNIDGLHSKAMSKNVIELHGNLDDFSCVKCNMSYKINELIIRDMPRCLCCNSVLKPSVVLYGENLDNSIYFDAAKYIEEADTLIVGGTSLTVEPAASLVRKFKGRYLVIINKSKTIYDNFADLVIYDSLVDFLPQLKQGDS